MQFADVTGLAGIALCFGAIVLACPPVARLGRGGGAALFLLTLLVLALPKDGLPLAAYVRGITGDLSVTTVVLAAASVADRILGRPRLDGSRRPLLLGGVVALACLLYPFALGLGPFDPYRLGFGDIRLVIPAIALALLAWRARCHLAAGCIALALLAWYVGWYESNNLWDYLIDPLLAVYAAGALLAEGMRRGLAKVSVRR